METNQELFNITKRLQEMHEEENIKIKDLLNRFSIAELRTVKNFLHHFFFTKEQYEQDLKEEKLFDQTGLEETEEYPHGWIGLDETDCSLKNQHTLLYLEVILDRLFELKSIKGE